MLSMQGIICKDLKRQNKLPEKFKDLACEPKRVGSLYKRTELYEDDPNENFCPTSTYTSSGTTVLGICAPVKNDGQTGFWPLSKYPLREVPWEFQAAFMLGDSSKNSSFKLVVDNRYWGNGRWDYRQVHISCGTDGSCYALNGGRLTIPKNAKTWFRLSYDGKTTYSSQYSWDGENWDLLTKLDTSTIASDHYDIINTKPANVYIELDTSAAQYTTSSIFCSKDIKFVHNGQVLFSRG